MRPFFIAIKNGPPGGMPLPLENPGGRRLVIQHSYEEIEKTWQNGKTMIFTMLNEIYTMLNDI